MAVKKITWRWLLNSFGVIVLIILIIEVLFAFGISRYYYNSVSQTLAARAEFVNSTFTQYFNESSGGTNFRTQMRDYVASFSAREQMELMVIDGAGQVILTSSGFTPDDKGMADYHSALVSEDKVGKFIGSMEGERVMAMSFLSNVNDSSLSAVRLVVSLTKVDRQIVFWIICMAILGMLVLLLVLFSSSYFLSSIVNPVGEVSETARKIAQGDFGTRLENKTNDEIGELCDTINDMAEKLGEAERLKNDFISSVSHELRTPLTAIQGWGETILDDGGKDAQMLQRGMGVIISETSRLSQMVEELLDFSRMQSGRLQLEMDKVDVLAELSDVVLMYTERAKRDGIAIVYNDNDLLVPVYGDKNKLRQVFVNIIDNAVKYSDAGGTIQVRAHTTDRVLSVIIEDNGIGIAPENLPQVKKKFFKVSTTRRSSGIGLAVADEIITRHDGELDIQSRLDKGTVVTIRLPVLSSKEKLAEGQLN